MKYLYQWLCCLTSPNFPEEHLPPLPIAGHIFERFYMGKSGKSGIGLALTKEIIHLHKGTIRAYNGDTGAVFEITLPMGR